MEAMLGLFVLCVFLLALAFYLYNKSEVNSYGESLSTLKQVKIDQDKNDKSIIEFRTLVLETARKVKDANDMVLSHANEITKLQKELMETNNRISNKRPIIRFEGPVPMQIIDPKTAKEIKRKLKAVAK